MPPARRKNEAATPYRVAVLNSHPIQYFAPLYRQLDKDPALEMTALYLSDVSLRGGEDPGFGQKVRWDIDLLEGYQSLFVGGDRARHRTPAGFLSLVAPQLWSLLRRQRYDALIVHGQAYCANLIAIAAAKSVGTPVFMRVETHLGLSRSGWKRRLRKLLVGGLYRALDGFLAIGSGNADFYRSLGIPDAKIFLAPYSVDNARFSSLASASLEKREEVRQRFGIPASAPAILFAGKFTRRKHPEMILQAAERIRATLEQPFSVVMCGAGEMTSELREYCEVRRLDNVVFTGFVNQADLPELYAACDVFVLPSEDEPWALTVNEAMCCGLPVVVSPEVGCVPDLVQVGVNGFTPERNSDEWASALRTLVTNTQLRLGFGQASRKRMETWSYEEVRLALRAALDRIYGDVPPERAGKVGSIRPAVSA
jgi:glycosyltransferase involved in cell wall biosynthesis